jgi:hypothetical protein
MNKVLGIAMLLAAYGCVWAGAQENDLLNLAKSGIEEEILISYIDAAKGPFHLTADQIIELKDLGVTTKVISEALKHDGNTEPVIAAPAVAPEVAPAPEPAVEPPVAPMARDTTPVVVPMNQPIYTYPWWWSPYYDYYWPYTYVGLWWGPTFWWGHGAYFYNRWPARGFGVGFRSGGFVGHDGFIGARGWAGRYGGWNGRNGGWGGRGGGWGGRVGGGHR